MDSAQAGAVVLVTGTSVVPREACDLIEERGFKVRLAADDNLDAASLHEQLAGASGYLIGGNEKPQAEHFERAGSLAAVAWVGTDYRGNVPGWHKAFDLGIAFVSTPGENARSVAELTLLLILSAARPFTDQVGLGAAAPPQEGIELHGRTLGIVGAGRIGARVAAAASSGLGMRVLYTGRRRNEALEAGLGITHVSLGELLECSDVVSLHRPAIAAAESPTLGRPELERMRQGALLVNAAHHSLVDPQALLRAIEQRGIRAAFDEVGSGDAWRPLVALGPPRFLSLPLMGALTRDAGLRAGLRAARAVCDVLSGLDSDSVNNPGFRELRRR